MSRKVQVKGLWFFGVFKGFSYVLFMEKRWVYIWMNICEGGVGSEDIFVLELGRVGFKVRGREDYIEFLRFQNLEFELIYVNKGFIILVGRLGLSIFKWVVWKGGRVGIVYFVFRKIGRLVEEIRLGNV